MAVNTQRLSDQNGDHMYGVFHVGMQYGTVRFNPRTGDYHGVTTAKGKIKSRYYGTLQGAAKWVLKQHDTRK